MNDRILIDTNLWVYLYAKTPQDKHQVVRKIISENFSSVVCSTQVLGELYNVLTKKNLQTKEKAKEIIVETMATFPVLEVAATNVLKAIDLNKSYSYSYWDSLLIATALLNDCSILYSEDMQHNQLIDDKTKIVNPFFKEAITQD